jgi:hypothetical protein
MFSERMVGTMTTQETKGGIASIDDFINDHLERVDLVVELMQESDARVAEVIHEAGYESERFVYIGLLSDTLYKIATALDEGDESPIILAIYRPEYGYKMDKDLTAVVKVAMRRNGDEVNCHLTYDLLWYKGGIYRLFDRTNKKWRLTSSQDPLDDGHASLDDEQLEFIIAYWEALDDDEPYNITELLNENKETIMIKKYLDDQAYAYETSYVNTSGFHEVTVGVAVKDLHKIALYDHRNGYLCFDEKLTIQEVLEDLSLANVYENIESLCDDLLNHPESDTKNYN